jgi:hypothetical protein
MMTTRTITLPTDQWEAILEVVQGHWDEGPRGEGWQGSRLSAASAALSTTLAQPEPEGPTDEEIDEWQSHCAYLTRSVACGGAGTGDHYWAFDVESDHVASIVRAALARWGRPTIKPVPVAERPWEREGWCDAEGRCWWWCHRHESWELDDGPAHYRHSLPHHALPIPTP